MPKRYQDLVDQGDRSGVMAQVAEQRARVQQRMASVRHQVAVMSGKGGVGKSALTTNLAAALAARGKRVGVLDADLNGPSAAKMLGARGQALRTTSGGVAPAIGAADVKVMSMDLFLAHDDAPVVWAHPGGLAEDTFIWRGTLEASTLREFLADTDWGVLDYLFIDLPPGTDRFPTVAGLLPDLGGAIVVTVPSDASQFVVSKSIALVIEMGIPLLGLVVNMAGFLCPHCGETSELFEAPTESAELAISWGLPYLGAIPFDPRLSATSDRGRPLVLQHPDSPTAVILSEICGSVDRFFMEPSA